MLHHEESPEKPQYNMAIPPFLDKPPSPILPNPPSFPAKIFRPPSPFPSILKKLTSPLYEGGVRTMGTFRLIFSLETRVVASPVMFLLQAFRIMPLSDHNTKQGRGSLCSLRMPV